MAEQTVKEKPKKFLFDRNVFDEGHVEEEDVIEDLPPPPPVFSEDELESAKAIAYAEGRAAALQEAENLKQQKLLKVTEAISLQIQSLFVAEQARQDLFEEEAVSLALALIRKLFPVYAAHHGLAELQATISDILRKQDTRSEIQIFLHPDSAAGLEPYFQTLLRQESVHGLKIIVDTELDEMACRMQWSQGGALSNPQQTAQEIVRILEQLLAENGTKGHDEKGRESQNGPQGSPALSKPDHTQDGA